MCAVCIAAHDAADAACATVAASTCSLSCCTGCISMAVSVRTGCMLRRGTVCVLPRCCTRHPNRLNSMCTTASCDGTAMSGCCSKHRLCTGGSCCRHAAGICCHIQRMALSSSGGSTQMRCRFCSCCCDAPPQTASRNSALSATHGRRVAGLNTKRAFISCRLRTLHNPGNAESVLNPVRCHDCIHSAAAAVGHEVVGGCWRWGICTAGCFARCPACRRWWHTISQAGTYTVERVCGCLV